MTLWADLEGVVSIAFFSCARNFQSKRGFRLWPKRPAWGRNIHKPKRHVCVPKCPYINFGELVCRRVGLSATLLSTSWFVGELSSDLLEYDICRLMTFHNIIVATGNSKTLT